LSIVGIILTNQCIGPIGAKYLLRYSNEDGKGNAEVALMTTPSASLN
jgi:hypothetical protein